MDSSSITVTNHRLKKAMSNANDDDLKAYSQKLGNSLKSELTLKVGKVTKIYPSKDKAEVQLLNSNKKETCLIAHDILSEDMNVIGFPKGRTHVDDKGKTYIIPSEKIYGVILGIGKDSKEKVLLSFISRSKDTVYGNAKPGEYKIQVGNNIISVTDKYINIKSKNLFVNGLPYTEAYKPLKDYHNKKEIKKIKKNIDKKINKIQKEIDGFVDKIYPVGSIYMSTNNADPSLLFGGLWERIGQGKTLIGEGTWTDSRNETKTFSDGTTGGEYSHVLTRNEIPKHYHPYTTAPQTWAERDSSQGQIISPSSGASKSVTKYTDYQYTEGDTDKPHNNIQPYLVVYMWKRIK